MSETLTSAATQAAPAEPAAVSHFSANLFAWSDRFVRRHIGPSEQDMQQLLATCGFKTLDALIDTAVPSQIRLRQPLNLPASRSERGLLDELRKIAFQNRVFRSFIGMGYHDCITPPVIQRNVLENPGWYTQYTPYQAEIAQGRLEALLNFQTMVINLTAMEIANASLLDEATAAAEAMTMCHRLKGRDDNNAIFISETCHPQTIEVVRARAKALGIEVVVGRHESFSFSRKVFAVLVQYPATDGHIPDYRPFVQEAHKQDALVIVAADLLSLSLLTPPGEFGADVVVGNAQRFGVPLGYGGPHAAYFATRDAFKRHMPGRLVGVSKDAQGRPALRLALQTREQHIRREKATSNICTAQVLLAIIASMYAVYHGPEGLRKIAERIHLMTRLLAAGLQRLGYKLKSDIFFDTLCIDLGSQHSSALTRRAEAHHLNVRVLDAKTAGVTLDETTSEEDLQNLLRTFGAGGALQFTLEELARNLEPGGFEAPFARTSPYL